jgi:3-methyl-2-oxobutanoate hydroxymethyltransferase
MRMTVPSFRARKGSGPPLVVLTAYDAATTEVAEGAGVDCILVGDSLGMVVLGHENTLRVTVDDMVHHAAAVGRVRRDALLVVDMPWLSYHVTVEDAVRNAARLVQETVADAVKLEGGAKRVEVVRAILDAEIPVMGHVGLTPQSVLAMGGYKVQGREETAARRVVEDARAIVDAGAFSLVLEGVPAELARTITEQVAVPTIGIGAGAACDGQVLVVHDLLGMLPGKSPKFVRRYADLLDVQVDAVRRWADDVRSGAFPAVGETYK